MSNHIESSGGDAKALIAIGKPGTKLKKFLVPVADNEIGEMLIAWLAANPQLASCELMLVNLVEPTWWNDQPYSGAAAVLMIDAHEEMLIERKEMLLSVVKRIKKQFPEVRTSWQVLADWLEGETISRFAKEWLTDCILVFAKPKADLRLFGGDRLIKQIRKSANCIVQVVQPKDIELNVELSKDEQRIPAMQDEQFQPSGI